MKHINKFLIFCLPFVLTGCLTIFNFEESFKREILDETPIGATRDEVLAYIQTSDWKLGGQDDHEVWFYINSAGEKRASRRAIPESSSLVSSYIYGLIAVRLQATYDVYWIFNESGQLIEVHVEKIFHSLV